MNTQLDKMCDWERQKAVYLMNTAENDLGMKLSGYGELAVNPNSGNTYLWLEDHAFTLYMPINCDLEKTAITAVYSCPIDGEEEEMDLDNNTTLKDLEAWAMDQCELSEKKEEA